MPTQNGLALHVLEAELAHVETPQTGIFLRIRRVVPGAQFIAAKQDGLDHVAPLSDLALEPQFLLCTLGDEERGEENRLRYPDSVREPGGEPWLAMELEWKEVAVHQLLRIW